MVIFTARHSHSCFPNDGQRWRTPCEVLRLRAWRLGNLCHDIPLCKLLMGYPTVKKALDDNSEWPKMHGQILCQSFDVRKMWRTCLYTTADGQGLKSTSSSTQSSKLVTAADPGISGSQYFKMVHTCLALFKTRLRATHGRGEALSAA